MSTKHTFQNWYLFYSPVTLGHYVGGWGKWGRNVRSVGRFWVGGWVGNSSTPSSLATPADLIHLIALLAFNI